MTGLFFRSIASSSSAPTEGGEVAKGTNDETAITMKRTLRSINRYCPVMASNKTLSLHSVDEDVYPRLWSFWAELMLVESGCLSVNIKGAIAYVVVHGRRCQGEGSTSSDDPFEAAIQAEAIKHAEQLSNNDLSLQMDSSSRSSHSSSALAILPRGGKAEVALVVLLYRHLNRTSTALLGDIDASLVDTTETSPARGPCMLNVVVSRIRRAFQPKSLPPGITSPIFDDHATTRASSLPEHLRGAGYAGMECAHALARLISWVASTQQQLIRHGLLTWDLLIQLDKMEPTVPIESPMEICEWVSRQQVHSLARVLLLTSFAPQFVSQSGAWMILSKVLGKDRATTLVIWWSLRLTLQQARGLHARRSSACSSSKSSREFNSSSSSFFWEPQRL